MSPEIGLPQWRGSSRALVLAVLAILLVALLAPGRQVALGAPAHAPTGTMAIPRARHAAALLGDGRVLVAGGLTQFGNVASMTASAEIYNPGTGTWTSVPNMSTPRADLTATTLNDGRVLVAGGNDGTSNLASAEIYDPRLNIWTSAGSMALARSNHTATLLKDGRVLVTGGFTDTGATAVTEIYDPATNAWHRAEDMRQGRAVHTATLLLDGRVLVAGGLGPTSTPLQTAEIFDPVGERWTLFQPLFMVQARYAHTATLLNDGRVLVAGGFSASSSLAGAEIYNPNLGTWSAVGSMTMGRGYHTATLLPDGEVLVAGGQIIPAVSSSSTGSMEIFNPATNGWTSAGSLGTPRYAHTATRLQSGLVLFAGGLDGVQALSSTELYTPANLPTATPTLTVAPPAPTATPIFTPTLVIIVPAATRTPTPTATPPGTATPTPTATPPPSLFHLRGIRVEKYGSKPDWQLKRQGLGRVRAGSPVRLSVYVRFTSVPITSHIIVTAEVRRAGKVVYRGGMTEDRPNSGDLWNHWTFTPRNPGRFVFTGRVTVDNRTQLLRTSFTAVQPRISFSFDRLVLYNQHGKRSTSFSRDDRVALVATITIHNAVKPVPATVGQTLEYQAGKQWKQLGQRVQSTFAASTGTQSYTISFAPQSPYKLLRMVVDVTVASRTQRKAVVFAVHA